MRLRIQTASIHCALLGASGSAAGLSFDVTSTFWGSSASESLPDELAESESVLNVRQKLRSARSSKAPRERSEEQQQLTQQ